MKAENLGERLKLLRIEREKSVRDVATDLEIGKSTLSCYENNIKKPSYEVLGKLADYYNVTMSYLLGEETVYEFKGDDLPLEVRELGVEYIPVMKKLKDNKIPKETIDKMVDAIIDMNSKNK